MKFISKIEINYFRSIYGVNSNNISDVNVIVGGNDVGKSNYLRALNLFFNNETSYDEELDFLQDVTHLREAEATAAKGRLTIWVKIHFNNILGWKTLPDKFYVKKTWNRYASQPEIKSDILKQQTLTRFLNKLEFHYIPAVKDPDIFAYYLVLLYETLAKRQDINFEKQAKELSDAVSLATNQMSERINVKLGVKSQIKVPTDLEAIFERFEFSTKQNSKDVPLQNRGDGIQARHIPHILDYISRNNGKYNIWGYEEPENSLEMGNSYKLSDEFINSFGLNNQIFITSHSPAFYGLESENVTTLLARKSVRATDKVSTEVTVFEEIDSSEQVDTDLGIATFIYDRTREIHNKLEALSKTTDELKSLSLPIVLTEGSTDTIILQIAWSKLYPLTTMPFIIQSCDVGHHTEEKAGADQLKLVLEATPKNARFIRIGIFDNDEKGRKCYRNLKRHSSTELFGTVKFNDNEKSCAFLLPKIEWDDPYFDYASDDIPIEMMFPHEIFENKFLEYKFSTLSGLIDKSQADALITSLSGDVDQIRRVMSVKFSFLRKVEFAESVENLSPDKFSRFTEIFDSIRYCLEHLN